MLADDHRRRLLAAADARRGDDANFTSAGGDASPSLTMSKWW
jgi:hypothetical protein